MQIIVEKYGQWHEINNYNELIDFGKNYYLDLCEELQDS